MIDTAPKTLVEEMATNTQTCDLITEMLQAYLDDDRNLYPAPTQGDRMQAAARVLLERMDESFKNRMVERMLYAFKTEYSLGASTRDRDRVKAAAQEFLRAFRHEHGLSAEDEI